MSKETKASVEVKKEEVKFTRQEEIDYSLGTSGPLYINPEHIKPGYHYCFVSNKPGEIEMYKRRGYEVVQGDYKVGDQVASSSTMYGSAVTVQSKCGQLLVLMAITDEKYDRFEAFKDKQAKEREQALGHVEGIPENNTYGTVRLK
jgi:hypothetical protein